MLYIVESYPCMQFQGKLIHQTRENGKKSPSFGPDFGPFDPNFFFSWVLPQVDVRPCCKLSLYTISRKANETNLRKRQKPSFRTDFGPFGPNSGGQFFFQKSGFVSQ